MTMLPKLSIIVISYNTRDMTLACLRSVVEQTTIPYELIVVDNASADGSAEAIRAEFPDIVLLAETKNHGFAAANNLAAQYANAEHILLLNPDTVVLDHAIDSLFSFSQQHPKARIWGGNTLFGDGSLNPTSCWGRMTLWTLFCQASGLSKLFARSPVFNAEAYGGWQRNSIREVDIITGCFLLISRQDWNALTGFDTAFFMYGEEADLCLRARSQLAARPLFTPEASIIHYDGASERIQEDKMVRLLAAKMELVDRHFPRWQKPLAKALFHAWPLSRSIGLGILRTGSEQARSWKAINARRAEWRDGFSGMK